MWVAVISGMVVVCVIYYTWRVWLWACTCSLCDVRTALCFLSAILSGMVLVWPGSIGGVTYTRPDRARGNSKQAQAVSFDPQL